MNLYLKKYRGQILHCVIDLIMELLAEIVNNFKLKCVTGSNKCFLRTTKELYHGFFEWWFLLLSLNITGSTIETLRTLEYNKSCS